MVLIAGYLFAGDRKNRDASLGRCVFSRDYGEGALTPPVPASPAQSGTLTPKTWTLKFHPAEATGYYLGKLTVSAQQFDYRMTEYMAKLGDLRAVSPEKTITLPWQAAQRIEVFKKFGGLGRLRLTLTDDTALVFSRGLFSLRPVAKSIDAAMLMARG